MTQIVNRSGFEQTNYGLYIDNDVAAQLTYTFDWSDWLETGDAINVVSDAASSLDVTMSIMEIT
jgi:hypothetical protein